MAFHLISAYVDSATGYIEDAQLTEVNTMYSELLQEFYCRSSKRNTKFKAWMSSLITTVRELKDTMVFCSNTVANVVGSG